MCDLIYLFYFCVFGYCILGVCVLGLLALAYLGFLFERAERFWGEQMRILESLISGLLNFVWDRLLPRIFTKAVNQLVFSARRLIRKFSFASLSLDAKISLAVAPLAMLLALGFLMNL